MKLKLDNVLQITLLTWLCRCRIHVSKNLEPPSSDPIVREYFKYRRLLKGRPYDKILKETYKVALAKLQTSVSKFHNNFKKFNGDEQQKTF